MAINAIVDVFFDLADLLVELNHMRAHMINQWLLPGDFTDLDPIHLLLPDVR